MLLLDTLPMLGNVLLLCFFVFFIFGIIGVQLWAGTLRQRCFIDLPSGTTTEEIECVIEFLHSVFVNFCQIFNESLSI